MGGPRKVRQSNEYNDSKYQISLANSSFDTFRSDSVRPSSTFVNITRQQAMDKHYAQVPKNLFNPMTD